MESLRSVDHPRLAAVSVGASLCCLIGRFDQAVHYSEVGQSVIAAATDKVSYFGEAWLGSAYLFVGQPSRYVEPCRAQLTRTGDANIMAKANLAFGSAVAGSTEEAIAAAKGLLDAADAISNPWVLTFTLFACGYAFRDTDPNRSLEALRRAVLVAHCQRHGDLRR